MNDLALPKQALCRFVLGHIVATPNAIAQIEHEEIFTAMVRHASCDWGEVDTDDKAANDQALLQGTRLFSVYRTKAGVKFWIITEADRSSTTVLMPEDY